MRFDMSEERKRKKAIREAAELIKERLSESMTYDELCELAAEIGERFPQCPASRAHKRLVERRERFEKLWSMFLDAVERARKINAELELGISYDNEEIKQCLSEVFSIYQEAFSIFDIKLERDLVKRLENGKSPKEIKEEDLRMLEMAMAKDFFDWQISYPNHDAPFYTEEMKETRKALREAKRYFDKAAAHLTNEWRDYFEQQIDQITKGLVDILGFIEIPVHRRENEWLNRIIESVVDSFLRLGYSKNRAYKEVGELLVNEGLMEKSEHIVDKVRHRYTRHKEKYIKMKQSI